MWALGECGQANATVKATARAAPTPHVNKCDQANGIKKIPFGECVRALEERTRPSMEPVALSVSLSSGLYLSMHMRHTARPAC